MFVGCELIYLLSFSSTMPAARTRQAVFIPQSIVAARLEKQRHTLRVPTGGRHVQSCVPAQWHHSPDQNHFE